MACWWRRLGWVAAAGVLTAGGLSRAAVTVETFDTSASPFQKRGFEEVVEWDEFFEFSRKVETSLRTADEERKQLRSQLDDLVRENRELSKKLADLELRQANQTQFDDSRIKSLEHQICRLGRGG